MSLNNLLSGDDAPRDINVVIESPLHGSPVKYEVVNAGTLMLNCFTDTMISSIPNCGFLPDDAGEAYKVLAVPVSRLNSLYIYMLSRITYFFDQYESLETGKRVKVENRPGVDRHIKKYSGVSRVIIAKLLKFNKLNVQGAVTH